MAKLTKVMTTKGTFSRRNILDPTESRSPSVTVSRLWKRARLAGSDRRQHHLAMRFGPCPSRIGPCSIFQLVLSKVLVDASGRLCCSSSVSERRMPRISERPLRRPITTLRRRSSALLHMPAAEYRNKQRTVSREIPASPPADDKALTPFFLYKNKSQVERLFLGTAKEGQ